MFNFGFINRIKTMVSLGAAEKMTDLQFIERELTNFLHSPGRRVMIDGERYFKGKQNILRKKRMAIGNDGELTEVKNLPNSRIVDNQYRKMVNQKKNYLLGQPPTFQCDDDRYNELLKDIFDKNFLRLLKNTGADALNCGLGWIFVYYDEEGRLSFRRYKPYEILPFWSDAEHTRLDAAVRVYGVTSYEEVNPKVIRKVEVYGQDGITFFERNDSGFLVPCEPFHQSYFTVARGNNTEELNWTKIPLVAFKRDDMETPLIKAVKSLQDGLNEIESRFKDAMDEDPRNTIIVLVNYDGTNLGEFRENLAVYGAVKVRSTDGSNGDVRTLQIEVNAENYKAILEIFKKAIIENAMGYDAKDDRLAGNPNQMNIQSMYSDIDLDANDMESEFQAAMEELLWFVNCHFANTGQGDYFNVPVKVIFNRDMLINESEIINDCRNSVDIISNRTIIANHPYVDDVEAELEQLEKEKQEAIEQYRDAFGGNVKIPVKEGNEDED